MPKHAAQPEINFCNQKSKIYFCNIKTYEKEGGINPYLASVGGRGVIGRSSCCQRLSSLVFPLVFQVPFWDCIMNTRQGELTSADIHEAVRHTLVPSLWSSLPHLSTMVHRPSSMSMSIAIFHLHNNLGRQNHWFRIISLACPSCHVFLSAYTEWVYIYCCEKTQYCCEKKWKLLHLLWFSFCFIFASFCTRWKIVMICSSSYKAAHIII